MDNNLNSLLIPPDGYVSSAPHVGVGEMNVTKRRKIMDDNMHLMDGMCFINGMPCLHPYNGTSDFNLVAYHERSKHEGKDEAVHFFIDDYRFRDAVWYSLEKTTHALKKFDIIFAPDLSLWRNAPTEFFNVKNVFRSRFVAAYWQRLGLNVIPVASWGGMDSFAYCFDGLPEKSVIAVSGMGNRKSSDSFNRWCHGVRRLEEEKNPSRILVYGEKTEVRGLTTPLTFMESFITKRFRNGEKNNGRARQRALG